jgi:addiction module HigA family antidote
MIDRLDFTNLAHPGEILLEEFLRPMDISQYRLAKDINVDPRRINEIVHGQRAITADTAFRLGFYFGMTPEFWLNLQSHYDLERLRMDSGPAIQREVKARP